jgi:phage-related minor tail protein
LGLFGGSATGSGNIFSAIMGVPGRASGGPVMGNTPYMVGEKGPELFVPSSSGNIVPNGQLGGTNVSYTINAVDAASFRQMLAREPEFLYAVTEKGRSSVPAGRR